jgi:hypothetical protein
LVNKQVVDPTPQLRKSAADSISVLDNLNKDTASDVATKNDRLSKIEDRIVKLDQSKLSYDQTIFNVGLPIFASVVIVILLMPKLYAADIQSIFFQSPVILNLFTVFILSMAIIILAVTKNLEAQSVGTLLGGIAGYVLGSAKVK